MVIFLTLPGLDGRRKGLITVTCNLLKPSLSIVPFCTMAPMHVQNACEVPEYEIDPKELDFTNSIEITKGIYRRGGTQVAVKIFWEGTADEDRVITIGIYQKDESSNKFLSRTRRSSEGNWAKALSWSIGKIAALKKEIETVRKHRKQYRNRRSNVPVPVVSLVGYTNAGKSTPLNRLTGAHVLAEAKLFATLDPTTRRVQYLSNCRFRFTTKTDLMKEST